MFCRFEKFRPVQKEMASDIYGALQSKLSILCHAPTGIGKTDAALGPALAFAIENKLSVLFLTPKISQHRIAVDAVKGIAAKYSLDITGSDIVGKQHMCCHRHVSKLSGESFYRACELARKEGRCEYYKNVVATGPEEQTKVAVNFRNYMTEHRVMEEFHETRARSEAEKLCPYEMSFRIGEQSEVVVSDYLYFFIPSLRSMFLSKLAKNLNNLIVIVDEAHNVPDRLREHLSSRINYPLVERALEEARLFGREEEFEKLRLGYQKFASLMTEKSEERIVEAGEFASIFDNYEGMIALCSQVGDEFIGKYNRRSAALKLGNFLAHWKSLEEGFVRIISRDGGGFSLAKRALDPSQASEVLNHVYSSVLMSGTLRPLDVYSNLMGVEHAILKEYPSPFPRENSLYAVETGATTKFSRRSDGEFAKIARIIERVVKIAPPKAAVFFPSFVVQKAVCRHLMLEGECVVQEEGMRPKEVRMLLKRFTEKGEVLLGVQGGSLSEGVDYANNELKCVIIVGMPFDDMNLETKSLIEYYEKKFGNGWEYAYGVPAMTKCMQAAGRGIRSETDKGIIVLLDERFGWARYRKYLPMEKRIVFADCGRHITAFSEACFEMSRKPG